MLTVMTVDKQGNEDCRIATLESWNALERWKPTNVPLLRKYGIKFYVVLNHSTGKLTYLRTDWDSKRKELDALADSSSSGI